MINKPPIKSAHGANHGENYGALNNNALDDVNVESIELLSMIEVDAQLEDLGGFNNHTVVIRILDDIRSEYGIGEGSKGSRADEIVEKDILMIEYMPMEDVSNCILELNLKYTEIVARIGSLIPHLDESQHVKICNALYDRRSIFKFIVEKLITHIRQAIIYLFKPLPVIVCMVVLFFMATNPTYFPRDVNNDHIQGSENLLTLKRIEASRTYKSLLERVEGGELMFRGDRMWVSKNENVTTLSTYTSFSRPLDQRSYSNLEVGSQEKQERQKRTQNLRVIAKKPPSAPAQPRRSTLALREDQPVVLQAVNDSRR